METDWKDCDAKCPFFLQFYPVFKAIADLERMVL